MYFHLMPRIKIENDWTKAATERVRRFADCRLWIICCIPMYQNMSMMARIAIMYSRIIFLLKVAITTNVWI